MVSMSDMLSEKNMLMHEKKILVCTISSHDFVNEPAFNFGVGDLMRVDEMNSLAQY